MEAAAEASPFAPVETEETDMFGIASPGDFDNFKRVDPLEKLDDLCDHLHEQIRG